MRADMTPRRSIAALVAALLGLAACGVRTPTLRPDAGTPAGAARLARLMTERNAAGPAPEYQIGAGDRLALTVVQVEALTGEFEVARDGSLLLPIIGTLAAAGRTERGLAEDITKRLAEG